MSRTSPRKARMMSTKRSIPQPRLIDSVTGGARMARVIKVDTTGTHCLDK